MSILSVYTIPVSEAITDALLPSLQKTISYISPSADLTNSRSFLLAIINPLVIGLYFETILDTSEELDVFIIKVVYNIGELYKQSENDLATYYLQAGQIIPLAVSKTSLYNTSSYTVDRVSQGGKKIYEVGTATHVIQPPDFTYSTVTVPDLSRADFASTTDAETKIPISSSITQTLQYKTNTIPAVEVIGTVILNSDVSKAIRSLVTDPEYALPIFEQSATLGITNNTSFRFSYNVTVTDIGYSSIGLSTTTKVVVPVNAENV